MSTKMRKVSMSSFIFLRYHVRFFKDLRFVSVNFLNKSLNVGSRPTHVTGRWQYGVSYSPPPHSS